MCPDTTRDNKYFEDRVRSENRPFYDWYSLAINFPYTEEVFNRIMRDQINGEEEKTALTDFLHEYIHYLQNFGSLWGIPKFIDLVYSFLLIQNSLIGYDNKYSVPLDIAYVSESSLLNSLNKRDSLSKKLNEYNFFRMKNQTADFSVYSCNTNDPHFAVLSTACFECNICMKVLRETQAFIAEKLYLGFTDDEINLCIQNTFHPNKANFSSNYVYWVLFDFFYSTYPNIKDIGKGLFFLIQDSLNRANPHTAVKKFIEWLNSNTTKYQINIKLPDLVNSWLGNYIETRSKEITCSLTFQAIEEFCIIIEKHSGGDELIALLSSIIEFSRRNMFEFANGIFQQNHNFSDITSWHSILERFGTGIIIFKDSDNDLKKNPKTLGTAEYQELMHKPFKFLFTINLQIEMLLNAFDFKCPFKSELPICDYDISDDSSYYCVMNAFQVDSIKEDNLMCLFDNCASVMGFKKSIVF